MSNDIDLQGKVAFDANSLNSLKVSARENSPEAIKGVAKQFEAIFMNMMLKSMRDATPHESPFESEQSKTFTAMLDQQLSTNLSNKGLGLAEILAKQLSKNGYANPNAVNKAMPSNKEEPATQISPLSQNTGMSANRFKEAMQSHAQEASRATGIPAEMMMGQAALETGWGKHQITGADGTASYNLFGIKAGNNWDGRVVEASTNEYINGIKQKRIEKFRAYDNYADSFKDFANLIKNNPRYENVVANLDNVSQYALAMKKAGYATDPEYAQKLAGTIQKVINS
jgi:flagellar protein FlgJ